MGRLLSTLERLLAVAGEKYRAYRKKQEERASTVPPAPALPHHQHCWNWYANWKPGYAPFERLEHPECAYCGEQQTERNMQLRCPFFG